MHFCWVEDLLLLHINSTNSAAADAAVIVDVEVEIEIGVDAIDTAILTAEGTFQLAPGAPGAAGAATAAIAIAVA